jgi:uncharacterized small protein (DUF1192 family)
MSAPSTNFAVEAALLDAKAKSAYSVYAHRTGSDIAWEWLPNEHRTAWKEVTKFLANDPECPECGEALLCIDCDSDQVYECPECKERQMKTCAECAPQEEAPSPSSSGATVGGTPPAKSSPQKALADGEDAVQQLYRAVQRYLEAIKQLRAEVKRLKVERNAAQAIPDAMDSLQRDLAEIGAESDRVRAEVERLMTERNAAWSERKNGGANVRP